MLAVAWLVMCAQQLILASSTLSAGALESALSSFAACAVWLAVSRASAAVGSSPRPSGLLACGAASSVAGVLLALSGGGPWSHLLLFAHVALACEVVSRVLAPPPGRPAAGAAGVAGAGLVCAAAVHALARVVAVLLGSAGNVGFYVQVSVVIVSLLPAAAAVARALPVGQSAPASGGGLPGGGRPVAVAGAAALVVLFGLFACMAMVFCGVVASPYQIDMLACGDRASFAAAVVGALVLACSRVGQVPGYTCSFGLAFLSIAGMLGGMVSYAVAADPAAPLPLAAIQAAGACLLASAWALSSLGGACREAVLAASIVALAVPARFLGFAVKHAVGLDGRTVTMFSLASTVALAVVLLVAVTVVAAASFRALRAAEGERERAIEDAIEDARHDPDHAFGAMRQVYRDAFSELGLSEREMEIAVLALMGNSNDEIGEAAGISPNTVRWHLNNIYTKVGVSGKKMLRAKVDELLSGETR